MNTRGVGQVRTQAKAAAKSRRKAACQARGGDLIEKGVAGRVFEIWPSLNLLYAPVTPCLWSFQRMKHCCLLYKGSMVISKMVTSPSSGINLKRLQIMIIMPPSLNNGRQCWFWRESPELPRLVGFHFVYALPNPRVVLYLLLFCLQLFQGRSFHWSPGCPKGC